MAYRLFHHLFKHRTHIIGGNTFAVRRYRNIRNRIIHRLLQYIRIIITTKKCTVLVAGLPGGNS